MPSEWSPRRSTSTMHISTTKGKRRPCALVKVVRSTPKTPRKSLRSGQQSAGIFSEHFLWAVKPQSRYSRVLSFNYFFHSIEKMNQRIHFIQFYGSTYGSKTSYEHPEKKWMIMVRFMIHSGCNLCSYHSHGVKREKQGPIELDGYLIKIHRTRNLSEINIESEQHLR